MGFAMRFYSLKLPQAPIDVNGGKRRLINKLHLKHNLSTSGGRGGSGRKTEDGA